MKTDQQQKYQRLWNVFLHLRLPFSFFLAPVFFFATGQSEIIDVHNCVILFIALHLFIYPGSNSYNSYMDKDEGSIGALEKPPPVTKDLYYASIILDLAGLFLMLFITIKMIPLMAIYVLISKIYSWNGIRLKKYPVLGWLVVVLFQGAYTFFIVGICASDIFSFLWFNEKNISGMLLSTLLIGAYYPLTQVYQHEEDNRRGDFTLSSKLGINGTFIFSAVMFLFSGIFSWKYFSEFYSSSQFVIFTVCLTPAILYFMNWFLKTLKEKSLANFRYTMRMTILSSTCLLISFLILLYLNHFSPA